MTDWPSFVDQHGPAVWRKACKLLGNEADAADCYQDVFIEAWKLSSIKAVSNWSGLLACLTTSRAIDRLRQRFRGRSILDPSPDWEGLASREPGPPEQAQRAEMVESFRVLVSKLPRKQAQVFCLHVLDELTHEEIATQLDAKPNAIAALLHRARQNLRRLLPTAGYSRKRQVTP
jgi:RNA polymerase sigma-70 factor (ECF subfamily)